MTYREKLKLRILAKEIEEKRSAREDQRQGLTVSTETIGIGFELDELRQELVDLEQREGEKASEARAGRFREGTQ